MSAATAAAENHKWLDWYNNKREPWLGGLINEPKNEDEARDVYIDDALLGGVGIKWRVGMWHSSNMGTVYQNNSTNKVCGGGFGNDQLVRIELYKNKKDNLGIILEDNRSEEDKQSNVGIVTVLWQNKRLKNNPREEDVRRLTALHHWIIKDQYGALKKAGNKPNAVGTFCDVCKLCKSKRAWQFGWVRG